MKVKRSSKMGLNDTVVLRSLVTEKTPDSTIVMTIIRDGNGDYTASYDYEAPIADDIEQIFILEEDLNITSGSAVEEINVQANDDFWVIPFGDPDQMQRINNSGSVNTVSASCECGGSATEPECEIIRLGGSGSFDDRFSCGTGSCTGTCIWNKSGQVSDVLYPGPSVILEYDDFDFIP